MKDYAIKQLKENGVHLFFAMVGSIIFFWSDHAAIMAMPVMEAITKTVMAGAVTAVAIQGFLYLSMFSLYIPFFMFNCLLPDDEDF